MHISQKLREAEKSGRTVFSFEFFPPKTEQGVQNLYDRIDRMHDLGPAFIDVTWNAGGAASNLTCEMVNVAQTTYGLETCMHLTCTDMPTSKVDDALSEAYKAGCTNILALRGDPPRDKETWEATEDGFRYAKDLVAYIKKKYGDHFDIGVAGYSEGCDDNDDVDELIEHLKEKLDAGGTFVVTQMFYDAEVFIEWVKKCRARGITAPIVPGIMPIQTHASMLRRAKFMNVEIPVEWKKKLDPIRNDDAQVREVGKDLVAEMCRKLLDSGLTALHFYTMNLAQATRMTLEELSLVPSSDTPDRRAYPWRQSLGLNRREEDVRPIFWKNRNKSYVTRTQDWDEFPNGRWGDARSPAFGQCDTYGVKLRGTNEANIKTWGSPKTLRELTQIFVQFLNGDITHLPWSESGLANEVECVQADLIALNQRGFLTINSQPAVNGVSSSDRIYGWGPRGGYCYQKAYLEFLVPPSLVAPLIGRIAQNEELTYYAVNKAGDLKTNAEDDSPNAVTWGVFPGKEIVQPTIVETISFLAWKDEAFRLGDDWARCHPFASPTRNLLSDIMQNWYLVNVVNNDFHHTGIFDIFDGLEVPGLDMVLETTQSKNGDMNGHAINGHSKVHGNGVTNGTTNGTANGVHTNGNGHHAANGETALPN